MLHINNFNNNFDYKKDHKVESIWKNTESRENILLLGNTGVGKSALLNILGGQFESDFSLIGGKTRKVSISEFEVNGNKIRLIDAPGLVEFENDMIKQNIEEVYKAFSYNGRSKLIFVFQSNSGRILPQDAYTLGKIITAVGTDFDIGLIINKVDIDDMEKYDDESKQKICEQLKKAVHKDLKLKTEWIICIPYDKKELNKYAYVIEELLNKMTPKKVDMIAEIKATVADIMQFISWWDKFMNWLSKNFDKTLDKIDDFFDSFFN